MKKLMLVVVLVGMLLVQGCYSDVYKEIKVRIDTAKFGSQLPAVWVVRSRLGAATSSREQLNATIELCEQINKKRIQFHLDLHPEFSDEKRQRIRNRDIWYGMNIWSYRAVRGSAYRTNLSSGTWGKEPN